MNVNRAKSVDVCILIGMLIVARAVLSAEMKIRLPLQGSIDEGNVGVLKATFSRPSLATHYSATENRLVEAPPNVPRFATFRDKSSGDRRGLLLETRAENLLLNSSFEMADALAHWEADGLEPTEGGIHGVRTLRITGARAELRSTGIVELTPKNTKYYTPTFTAYLRPPAGQTPQGKVRPNAWILRAGETDSVDIFPSHAFRKSVTVEFKKTGTGNWWRMFARIQEKESGGRYQFGLGFRDAEGMLVDALQLEKNHLPWTASSYIPTHGKASVRRADILRVKTAAFSLPKGSVSMWTHSTNPGRRSGYLMVHPPIGPQNRIFLTGQSVQIGKPEMRYIENLWQTPEGSDQWRLIFATWDGTEAAVYVDGREFARSEGPWEYTDLVQWTGEMIIGSNGQETSNGAEGVVADFALWNRPLSASEIASLYRTGDSVAVASGKTDPLSADRESERVGVPVSYVLPVAGNVSLGIFDQQGSQIRHLINGEAQTEGKQTVHWSRKDDDGKPVRAGSYEFRGIVGNVEAEWVMTVGNSGQPPWVPTKVRCGLWNSIAPLGDGLVANSMVGEGGKCQQAYDADGQVLWTAGNAPIHARYPLLAADEKYVYVLVTPDEEKDDTGHFIYDTLWRLDAKTGKPVPWAGGHPLKQVTEQRHGNVITSTCDPQMAAEPWPDWSMYDLEAAHGKLYLPLHKEKAIRVLDRNTGDPVRSIDLDDSPRGLAVAPSGELYVGFPTSVVKYSAEGQKVETVVEGLEMVWDVELDTEGNIYVSQLGSVRQIRKYSPHGKLLQTFGRRWSATQSVTSKTGFLDQLFLPVSFFVADDGKVLVADYANGRIAEFAPDVRFLGDRVETFGRGGMDGSVALVPGDPLIVLAQGICLYSGGNLLIQYELDLKQKTWKTVYRWPQMSPAYSSEPSFAQRMNNGRIYHFFLGRYPSVWEVIGERLVFCSILMHPQRLCPRPDRPNTYHMRTTPLLDFHRMGLTDDDLIPKYRFVWTDRNRDGQAAENEINGAPAQVDLFYTTNDADLDSDGNLYLYDYGNWKDKGNRLYRLPLAGFDAVGNPLYDWKQLRELWYLHDHDKDMPENGKGAYASGKRIDAQGNTYFGVLVGNGCFPERVRLASYDSQGRLRWKFGRKARGYKDKPGEFTSIPGFCRIIDDSIYILDYDGMVDVMTKDGLHVATLLESGSTGNLSSPYSNWGENFYGDGFKDERTDEHYIMINTHNYALPLFKVKGIRDVRRFYGRVDIN